MAIAESDNPPAAAIWPPADLLFVIRRARVSDIPAGSWWHVGQVYDIIELVNRRLTLFGGIAMKSKARKVKKPIRKAPAAAATPAKPAGIQLVAAAADALKGAGVYNNPKLSSPMVSFRMSPALKAALIQLADSAESWSMQSVGKQIKKACRDYVLSPENKKRLPEKLLEALQNDGGRYSRNYY